MYPFKRRYLRIFIRMIDFIGERFFLQKKTPPPHFKSILIIRLDQIGDIVLSQPFITILKKNRPDAKLIFLTTPAGHEILGQLPDIDEFVIFDPGWFAVSSRDPFAVSSRDPQGRGISSIFTAVHRLTNQIRTFFSLVRCLKQIPADVIVDLRGDFRHILAARLAKPKSWLLSYGSTGGEFLLDCVACHSEPAGRRIPSLPPHAIDRNMNLLNYLNVQIDSREMPSLSPHIASSPLSSSFLQSKKEGRWIALHMSATTPSKLWPLSHWKGLIDQMIADPDIHFFLIGDKKASDLFQKIGGRFDPSTMSRFTNLCGKLLLSQLGTFLKMCDLLISVDSAPVHIASAHGVKTIVLFSGTTEPDIWKPLNPNAKMLTYAVSCAPCHERICPKEKHLCMEELTPQRVYSEAQAILS